MKYVSVCAGIEAATVAWHPLGWEPVLFSEIEPFPRAVLQHHYPDVPLIGDFTQMLDWTDPETGIEHRRTIDPPAADLLVGGTPCQAFSVAGKRRSLEDYRGNLSLAFADLFHAGQYRWAVWENVPGVLSTKDNAFGCLLGRLVGSDTPLLPHRGGKWTNAGVVSGPLAVAAWRVLDAQYFGVAQRRRRVFVCVSRGAGNWAAARALLPVGESVSGHPPARRQAGEGAAGTAGPGVARSLRGQSNVAHREDDGIHVLPVVQGGGWPAALAPTLNAAFGEKQGLEDQHINGGAGMFVLDKQTSSVSEGVTGTLKTDLSHQMGPVVAVPQVLRNREGKEGGGKGPLLSENQSLTLATANDQVVFAVQNPTLEKAQNGLGITEGPMYTLESSRPHGVVAPTLSASNDPSRSPQSSEVTMQVAAVVAATPTLRPRRLTPRECERLQGFPDDLTLVPYGRPSKAKLNTDFLKYQLRGNPKHLTAEDCARLAADGPRYKALGNSMAVPVMAYIGRRIQEVEQC